ncbi:DUF887-domain-containing protein [Cytidiella melzeri]|nr:DUF887-domain-containing protein [Cytidiella melzeri]
MQNPLSSALSKLVTPMASLLGLEHLPQNFPNIAYSALGFTFVHIIAAPVLSRWIAPVSYAKLQGPRAKNNWEIHVVSLVHAVIIVVLAYRTFNEPALLADPAYGWHETAELTNSVAVGYFIWDTIDATVNYTDLGFVLHGKSWSISARPILQYFSSRFLFWELSTPFLNIHWFLDKTGKTGSTFQLINGVLLLSTFFFVRIVYGWYTSITFWRIMFRKPNDIPVLYRAVFLVAHTVLMTLNLVWFSKMISALRKRFNSDQSTKQPLLTPTDGALPNYTNTNPIDGAA